MNLTFEYDVIALILYAIIYIFYNRSKHLKSSAHYSFVLIIAVGVFTSILEIFGGFFVAHQKPVAEVAFLFSALFIGIMLLNFLYMYYVLSHVRMNETITRIRKIAIAMPLILGTVIVLLNPFTNMVYSYSTEQGFARGPVYPIYFILYVSGFVWSSFYVIRRRKQLSSNFIWTVIEVAIINIIPSVMEFYIPDFVVRGIALAISMFVLLVERQDDDVQIDSMTGIGNVKLLSSTIKRYVFNHHVFSSVLVRISDYDQVATNFGFVNVDQLSASIGELLSSKVKVGECFKISNSCYVVNISGDVDSYAVAKKLLKELDHEWKIDDSILRCSFYITNITYPKDFDSVESYRAFLGFFQEMRRPNSGLIKASEIHLRDKLQEHEIENAIKRGLEEHHFDVFYQPICTADSKRFMTAEALVRLNDPVYGMISPEKFIPLAERNGSIIAIGEYVLDSVCEFIASHDLDMLGIEYIEVNLSVVQCLQSDFIRRIDEITLKHNVSSKYICFEITETASNCEPEIFTNNLKRLSERGYLLALDDFGTGYGNLQRMITSSFDIIKLDREMTLRLTEDGFHKDVFDKMNNIFHSMNAKVVAEGVETEEQYEFLKSNDCDYIQGYYFSRPLPKEEYLLYLKEKR